MKIKNFTFLVTLISILLCFLSVGWAQAKKDYSDLKSQYGKDLKSAPFFLRQKFLNDTGKSWPKVSLEERGKFITDYNNQQKLLNDQEREREKIKIKNKQVKINEKDQRLREEKREAAQKQKVKNTEIKKEKRKKESFDKKVQRQKKKMKRLRNKR